jgi:hypothetical protein
MIVPHRCGTIHAGRGHMRDHSARNITHGVHGAWGSWDIGHMAHGRLQLGGQNPGIMHARNSCCGPPCHHQGGTLRTLLVSSTAPISYPVRWERVVSAAAAAAATAIFHSTLMRISTWFRVACGCPAIWAALQVRQRLRRHTLINGSVSS